MKWLLLITLFLVSCGFERSDYRDESLMRIIAKPSEMMPSQEQCRSECAPIKFLGYLCKEDKCSCVCEPKN